MQLQRRIDLHRHDDSLGIVRVEIELADVPDIDAVETHRRAIPEAGHRPFEIRPVVDELLAVLRTRQPHESDDQAQHAGQNEGAYRDVIGFSFHGSACHASSAARPLTPEKYS